MKKIFNEKNFAILIIVSIIAFPLLEIIGMFFGKKFFLQEEYLSLVGIIGIILTILGIINRFKNKDEKRFVLSDIFIITSIIFCIISIIFSQLPSISLTGIRGYSETPLQVLGYFTLFFSGTCVLSEKYRKWILNTFLVLGIFEAIVAFMQNFKMWPVTSVYDPSWHTHDHLAFGLTQHCNFFAPIAIIFTALFSMRFIYCKSKKEQFICLFGAIVSCLSTFFTYTRIGWVGIFAVLFGIILLEALIYFVKKDKEFFKQKAIKTLIIAISFVICFFVVGNMSGQIKKDVEQSKKEITSKNVESFGTGRGFIWKSGITALKKYPFTGVGFDLYNYSYIIATGNFFNQNKGHNEYLHTFVTRGIFSGINYMLLAFYCCFFALKKILKGDSEFAKSNITKFFLIALFAYFVQALFNSSVTNVAVYKWILMGLVLPRMEQNNLEKYVVKIKELSKKDVSFGKKK